MITLDGLDADAFNIAEEGGLSALGVDDDMAAAAVAEDIICDCASCFMFVEKDKVVEGGRGTLSSRYRSSMACSFSSESAARAASSCSVRSLIVAFCFLMN